MGEMRSKNGLPQVSFGLGDPNAPMPAYSAKNSQQVAPVFKAIGKNSAYHITQDGIKPGSSLDHYERETRWVDRHQKAEKDQRKQRQVRILQSIRTIHSI